MHRNEEADFAALATKRPFQDTIHEFWKAESVRARYTSITALKQDFPRGFDTPRWRCPVDLFQWFHNPIPLRRDPLSFGKEVLVKMHNNYQAIRLEHALQLLDKHLAVGSPIRQWLIDKEFDEAFLPRHMRRKPGQSSAQRRENFGAPAAKDPTDVIFKPKRSGLHPSTTDSRKPLWRSCLS
ncbi:hypothetical protein [Microvirga brassicacearum]|uniref:Uncharacterized protein n=1 Tax=Microvirga brassicacearum TaxID=2580413 RepID=A0A5N3P7R1_9HYPH|nr:hypothetical protein [Microvirga brassicacearum]KAB0265769.1 hypothetical protein FEZ63_17340 [Microvirga brassicacearum]